MARVRRAFVWLVAVPVVLGGAQLAHAADYWLIAPDAHERAELLAGTGHGYFQYLPFVVALFGALLVAGFVAVSWSTGCGATPVPRDRWLLGSLPVITFVLQEYLERFLHDGAFPWSTAMEPAFALGLVLQVPFAIVAYGIARLLLRAAEAIGRRCLRRRQVRPPVPALLVPAPVDLPRLASLASGYPSRGPPRLAPA